MEFFQEVLVNILTKKTVNVVFPDLQLSVAELVEMESFHTLQKIKAAISNNSLNDFECVEEIVCILEKSGISGGNRHDFG